MKKMVFHDLFQLFHFTNISIYILYIVLSINIYQLDRSVEGQIMNENNTNKYLNYTEQIYNNDYVPTDSTTDYI